MATLNLTKVFVNLVSTGEFVSGQSARGRPEDYKANVSVRTYAGGRRRAIVVPGVEATFGFTLLLVPRSTVETLRQWAGQQVQVRDHKGRVFYGVYDKVSVAEIVSRTTWNVSIELQVVTAEPGV